MSTGPSTFCSSTLREFVPQSSSVIKVLSKSMVVQETFQKWSECIWSNDLCVCRQLNNSKRNELFHSSQRGDNYFPGDPFNIQLKDPLFRSKPYPVNLQLLGRGRYWDSYKGVIPGLWLGAPFLISASGYQISDAFEAAQLSLPSGEEEHSPSVVPFL